MTGRATRKHAWKKNRNIKKPYRWPERLPLLSEDAKRIIGKNMSGFLVAMQTQALCNRKGFAAFDRGKIKWQKHVLVWEMRSFDAEPIYPNFDCAPIEVVTVLTKAEDAYNRNLYDAQLRAQHERYGYKP